MQRIRFCHVIDGSNLNPLLYNAIKFSDREKFEYTVISLEPENGLQEQMRDLGVRSFSLAYTSRRQAIRALWRLYKYFSSEKIQIVQTHLFDASLIGLTAARLARVPVTIFTGHHSHETPLHKRRLLTFIDGLSARLLAKHTIAPSEQMKQIFVSDLKVPAEKVNVIHHGFDLEDWRVRAAEKTRFADEFGIRGKIVFGAVGRLFWVKDFTTLIDGFASAAKEREDIVLVIVGDGNERQALQERIDRVGLTDKIKLTGRRTDIAAVMNTFDVFVHSSLAESFGMVFIEAFALGLPVISTRVGVAAEVIEDGLNGYLVATENPAEIAEAITKMLDQRRDWNQMAERCREIADGFTVRRTQAECDDFYLDCLGSK